ncbi:hypothetical protein GCM10011579_027320 [Streptomyces albiflavescens]|uniref:Uncharacterized protein n=1 Tax=Streptomyces albiflavescens TaxID=1623582 RepID=A0A918D2M2_9ACTN|nr:hypothetical protein [Streptomyces albiflavescens]GGN61249.1 hypothetical protein GCM10011579_027320 [Streptomyces albiflavescens]
MPAGDPMYAYGAAVAWPGRHPADGASDSLADGAPDSLADGWYPYAGTLPAVETGAHFSGPVPGHYLPGAAPDHLSDGRPLFRDEAPWTGA